MDPERSLPYSQASVTCLYLEPDRFSPCAPASFFKIHNIIILPFTHRGLLSGLSPQLYTTRTSTHFPFYPMPSTCLTHAPNKNIHFAVFASLLLPSSSQGHNVFHAYKKIIAVFHYSVTVSNESIFWKGSTITERHDKQSKFPFTSRSLKSVSRRRRDCSQCLSNSSAAELDFTSSQQNASPCMWQCQRHCARDTDAVISTARVYGNTSVHTDGS